MTVSFKDEVQEIDLVAVGVRGAASNVPKEESTPSELIEVVVNDQIDPGKPPIAQPENDSDNSSNSDEELRHDETVPRSQLLPPPKEKSPTKWAQNKSKFEARDTFPKLDLSNLKLHPSKSSLFSTMDKLVNQVPKSLGNKTSTDTKLRFFVGFLFLSCVLLIGGAHVLYYQHLGEVYFFEEIDFRELPSKIQLFPDVIYEEAARILRFQRGDGAHLIELSLGVGLLPRSKPFDCNAHLQDDDANKNTKCLEWYNQARLYMTHEKNHEDINCYNMYWQSLSKSTSPMDCFTSGSEYAAHKKEMEQDQVMTQAEQDEDELLKSQRPLKSQGHWFGGGESLHAAWPLQKGHIKLSPFVTGDEGQTEWGNAIRKYFVNSRGVTLTIADHTPLFVSVNDPPGSGLCLQARFDDFAYYYHRFNLPRLNYTICTNGNVLKLHNEFLPKSFWDGHKQRDLDTLHHLLKTPIWQVPADEIFSHSALERYVQKIIGTKNTGEEDYPNGYLLLDYHWQERMGDIKFKRENFPDTNATVQMIKDYGLKLVLTISPFISTESSNFAPGVKNDIFVSQRNASATVPALTWFKDVASCGMVDITNNQTAQWYRQELRNLLHDLIGDHEEGAIRHQEESRYWDEQQTPVAFFLQTGNTFHTPSYFRFTLPLDNPDLYREHFVGHVMDEVPVIGVSGASSRRPKAPAFVFLSPLEPKWSHLRSIIPNVLQLSVIGYPFINPGPVGGVPASQPQSENSVEQATEEEQAKQLQNDLELYIRWWQLNTFLPTLHFVKPPTAFPESLISGVAKYLKNVRSKIVLPELIRSANLAMQTSAPVIRPLWMIDPKDPITHSIDDQFLIGDTILVAPVLEYGKRQRNVYLPRMEADANNTVIWKRGNDGTFLKGGRWLNNTKVALNEVLYFVRQTTHSLPGLGLA